MGKPATACFKIIGCGGDAVDNDDLAPEEAKASSDKSRWSFRKRSSKHRVLSNSAISEPLSVCSSKENQEVSIANFHSPRCSSPETAQVQEKSTDMSPLALDIVNTEAPSLSDRSITVVGATINETDATVVQATIRGYLAKKELHKLKSLVKLQACVRGHLVRRKAIGTLRCTQAIIKMQALVRAHQLVKKLTSPEDKNFQKSNRTTKKLHSNEFARQLLETTPWTKNIYIKCDPSKSDSTWKWLERWTVVTSSVGRKDEHNFNHVNCVMEGKTYMAGSEHAVSSILSDPVMAPTKLIISDDVDNNLLIEHVYKNNVEKPEPKNELLDSRIQDYTDASIVNEEFMDCISDDKQLQPNLTLVNTVPATLEAGKDNYSNNTERSASETLENEGKKSIISSRKLGNPAFVAAQSKFEELSLKSTVGCSGSPAYQNAASKPKTENQNIQVHSLTDSSNEAISAENSVLHDSRVQAANSECGTEISISSTLDSPNRSEMEGGEIVLEIGALEKENYDIIADVENAFDLPNIGGDDISGGGEGDQSMVNSNVTIGLVQVDQHPAEPTTSDVLTHLEGTIEQARSPEGTARSHISVPDLHGTPSSVVSVNAKKIKKEKNEPTHKKMSQLVDKRSPNPHNDSCGRSSTENLTKDSKIQKRRISFGMAKADHVDQEPRLSTSNPLPGYMQATASARAKAHVSTSQKSSPDLNENHSKKRHSLPIENGKQNSSPRMQRSSSQAHQTVKGNVAHSPHNSAERKWQR
ncbi:protein IQ-DOMAIN 32-like [Canna indica]|uniref:Protein IQ-DOMAIN 32-like n=1 Tax=Canna indica TaxID=4628 RepID=A0AAQ3JUS0_9LILI|nr:protein IQ-DOMAIN 32-like [Canna indica]